MEVIYYCKHCNFDTKTVRCIKQHLLTKKHIKLSEGSADDYNKERYKCVECSKIFNDRSNANKHIKSIHTVEKKSDKNKTDIGKSKTLEFIDVLEKMPDKKESFRLLKIFLDTKSELDNETKRRENEIKQRDDEIKQIYKQENEYHKKLANNAGNIVNNTISAFACAVKNYKDAPKLKYLDSETAKNLLCQEKINGKVIKLDNNKTAEYMAKLSEQKILPKHLSNTLVEQYKSCNPKEQSVWTTDASRMKMIVKMNDNWIRDSNGKIVNEHMIVPLLNEMIKIIDQYNISNGMNIDKMKPDQEMKYAEVAMKILDIKSDISSEKINKEILRCLIPEFIMKHK
jgi:hypothetical protein